MVHDILFKCNWPKCLIHNFLFVGNYYDDKKLAIETVIYIEENIAFNALKNKHFLITQCNSIQLLSKNTKKKNVTGQDNEIIFDRYSKITKLRN